MKSISMIAITVCLFASFAVAGTASAQDHAVRVSVPFGFNVGNKWVPAGTYTITADSGSDYINIRSQDSSVALLSIVQPDSRRVNVGQLVFAKYGDQYFLHEILCSTCRMNVVLPGSKHEKLVRSRQEEAGLSRSNDVYLALR